MPSATPNSTLYVKNIDSKVKKPGAFWNGSADTELRRQLYYLFGSYGKVLDVVATRADGMRGQAFVVFRDLQSATAALRALEGFEFYQKPLSIDYARTRSKATIVAEYGEEALLRPDLLHKRADGTSLPSRVTYSSAQADLQQQEKKRTREETGAPEPAAAPGHERPAKTARTDDDDDDAMEIGDSDDE